VTVVGHVATIAADEWVTASGEWVNQSLGSSHLSAHRPRWCCRDQRWEETR
jgi:hypothetical protein